MAQAPRRRRPADDYSAYGLDPISPDAQTVAPFDYLDDEDQGGAAAEAKPENKPGFVSSVKRGFGGMVANTARVAEDVGLPARGLREYGEQLETENPAEVTSLGDIPRHPFKFLTETGGELAPQFAGAMAGARIGAMAGAPFEGVGAIPGAAIGGVLGAFAPSAVQSFGGQLRQMDKTGQYNRTRAGIAALVSGALDTVGPVDMLARRLVTTGAKKTGLGLGKEVLLKGGGEFGTEYTQDVVEDIGATGTAYTPGAGEGYLMSGFKGGVGGAATGLVEGTIGREKEDKTQNIKEEKVAPPLQLTGPTEMLALPAPGEQKALPPGEQRALPSSDTIYAERPEGPDLPGPPDVVGGKAPAREDQLADQRRPSQLYGEAIADIESRGSGGYKALGPVLKNGNRALGKYQVMRSNLAEWTTQTFGKPMSEQEFMSSPAAQDAVFDEIFGGYVKRFGTPEDAANAWFTGQPIGRDSGKGDILGTSPNKYVAKFKAAMARRGGGGGTGGVYTGGAPGAADIAVTPGSTPEELLARLNALSGETAKKGSPAATLARAIANDDDKADALIEKARTKWQEDALKLEQDRTLTPEQKADKGNLLDRRQQVLLAAIDTAKLMRAARSGQPIIEGEVTRAETQPLEPEPLDMAQAGEQLAADGALDRQVAAETPQPQPLDEASAKLVAATRSKALDEIGKNTTMPDKVAAFEQLRAAVPGIEPLTQTETNALKVAEHLQRFAPLTEAKAKPVAPEPVAEPAAETTPEPAAPASGREPERVAQINERARGFASSLGTSQKPQFYAGVRQALGDTNVEAPPEGTDRATWFQKGVAFVKEQDEETAEPAAEAPAKKQPKTEAAQKATTAKADKETVDKAAAEKTRAAVQAKRETAAKAKAAADKVKAEEKAAKRKTEEKAAAAKAKAASKAKAAASKAAAKARVAEEKAAAKPVKQPAPAPEPTEEHKLAAEIAVFEAKTQRAADTDTISAFQRQNLDVLADKSGNVELAEAGLVAEKKRFENGGKEAVIGKGDTLADVLARAKAMLEGLAKITFTKVETEALGDLTADEEATLAKHYGHGEFNDDAKRSFLNDVTRGVIKGWQAVDAAIRDIAKRVAAVILATALVFNALGVQDAKAASYSAMPPAATAAAMPLPTGLKGASKETQHVYRTVAPQMIQLSGEGKGFVIADKHDGKLYFFDKDAKLYYSQNALFGKASGDLLTAGGEGINNMSDQSRITPAGAFRVQVGKSIYGGGRSLKLPGTANKDGVVAVHAVWKGDPQVDREALLKEGDPSKAKVSFGCINTSEKGFIDKVLPHADELDGGLVVIIPDTGNAVDEFLKGDVKDAAQRVKVTPLPDNPTPAPTQGSSAPTQPKEPGLPPERARAAVQAARRRTGRGRAAMGPAPGLSPRALNDMAALDKRLRAALDRRGLADVLLETTTKATIGAQTGKEGTAGQFGIDRNTLQRAIQVAIDGDNPLGTLDHELVHALEDMGVIKPKDWTKLVAAARADPDIKAYVDEHYSDLSQYEQDGEAVAEMFSRWAQDPANVAAANVPGATGIVARIKGFFAALKSWITQSDYKTAEDVMRAIESGEVGAKERTLAPGSTVVGDARLRVEAKARRTEVHRAASALDLTARDALHKSILMLGDTEDVANAAAKLGITDAKLFVELHSRGHALARKFQARLVNIRDRLRDLPARYQGAKGIISKLMYDSTRSGKWAFAPTEARGFPASWKGKAFVDPKLAARFEAMSPAAQQVYIDTFKFNHDAREQLHKATLTAINAEFDPVIKGEDSTEAQKTEAVAAKARAIKYHSRVFNTQEGLPYTPLKRSGAWAIVGKSAAYKAAVAAKNHELIEKMREDPKHYFVDFRETTWEADKVRALVRERFGKDNAYVFERGKADQNAVSGVEMLVAFKRMQAAMEVEGVGNKASAKMEQMARDFYLHTLSDESSRKGELSRENVPGDTMDMMEAFFSRGNATAEYAASIQNNVEMQKSLRGMQKQVSQSSAQDRTAAQRFLNELMWRYEHNLSARPNRTVDRIVKGTSLYMLLTSPFYYLQNSTQAVLISHPALLAQFGPRATAEFWNAYGDFNQMTKGTGWLDPVDYSKHPDPKIAKLLERLAGRGRLDSGVTVEDNAHLINGDGLLPKSWNKVDKFFRMMPQRIEVQNRVVTGIAAYRSAIASGMSEDAAFEVASELIRTTHGDYSGFASPRVFTQLGQFGKIAGQFRKFQFIMGSHVVREFKKMIFGATPAEKFMAFKSLAFLSAHMAAVGGIVGQPAAAMLGPIIGALMNAIDDDDDKDWSDWKQSLRESLGAGKEKDRSLLADFLFKGAPYALLQMDTSDRMGMGNMLALAPYSGIEEAGTDKEKWYAVMGKAMLGPAGKIVADAVNGLDWGINHDDWARAAEGITPLGPTPAIAKNVLKAMRLQREGLTDKSGTTLFKPEDISTLDKVLTASGVNPRKLANQGEKTSERFKAEEYYSNKTGSMKRDYVKAFRARDARQLQEVRTEWKAIQEARKRDGFKVQPLGELLRSPREMARKDKRVVEGVAYTPATKRFVLQQMMSPDDFDEP